MVTLVVYFIVLVNVAKGLRRCTRSTSSSCARTPPRRRRCCARRGSRTPCRTCSRHSRSQPRRGHHGLRRRVLRRHAERSGQPHHVEHGHLQERRGVGVRARRLPGRSNVLPGLHRYWRASSHTEGCPPRGRNDMSKRSPDRGRSRRSRSLPQLRRRRRRRWRRTAAGTAEALRHDRRRPDAPAPPRPAGNGGPPGRGGRSTGRRRESCASRSSR